MYTLYESVCICFVPQACVKPTVCYWRLLDWDVIRGRSRCKVIKIGLHGWALWC